MSLDAELKSTFLFFCVEFFHQWQLFILTLSKYIISKKNIYLFELKKEEKKEKMLVLLATDFFYFILLLLFFVSTESGSQV